MTFALTLIICISVGHKHKSPGIETEVIYSSISPSNTVAENKYNKQNKTSAIKSRLLLRRSFTSLSQYHQGLSTAQLRRAGH